MNVRERGMPEGVVSGEIYMPTEPPKAPPNTEGLPSVIIGEDDEQNRIREKIIDNIHAKIESPETELGIDLKVDNHPDEWLVFVEDEVGQLGGDATGIIDKIKEIAEAKKTKHEEELKQEIKLTAHTLSQMGLDDIEIQNKLNLMTIKSEKENNISLNEFIKMLKEAQGNSMVAEEIIKRLEGLMNKKNIDLTEDEAKVAKNLRGTYSITSWIGYFEKRFTRINDYIDDHNINLDSAVDLKGFKDILLPKKDKTIQTNIHILTGLDALTKMTENQ